VRLNPGDRAQMGEPAALYKIEYASYREHGVGGFVWGGMLDVLNPGDRADGGGSGAVQSRVRSGGPVN